jgi:ribose 5-phosphate isomerase A
VGDDFAALSAKALEFVRPGTRIGLGTGHAADAFIRSLGERVRAGLQVSGVATSNDTARLARECGISVGELNDEPLDVTIDGADEVEPSSLNLIKGWGGALVRERIVAAAAKRQIILVGPEKIVRRLGTRGKLPVEIIPFAAPYCRRRIETLAGFGGLKPTLRGGESSPFVTDNGNWIFDCALEPQDAPAVLERALLEIPGVVDTGLFLGTASLVLVEEAGGVRELQASR